MLENKLLNNQLENYENLIDNLDETISFQKRQILNYKGLNNIYLEENQSLNKQVKKKNSQLLGWKIGGIAVTIGLLLTLIFK